MHVNKDDELLLEKAVKSHIKWAYYGTTYDDLAENKSRIMIMGVCFSERHIPKGYGILRYNFCNNSWDIFKKDETPCT